MFKCKQCGRQFGANVPDACPTCGAPQAQPAGVGSKRFWAIVFLGGGVELLILVLLAGIVAGLVIKFV